MMEQSLLSWSSHHFVIAKGVDDEPVSGSVEAAHFIVPDDRG